MSWLSGESAHLLSHLVSVHNWVVAIEKLLDEDDCGGDGPILGHVGQYFDWELLSILKS